MTSFLHNIGLLSLLVIHVLSNDQYQFNNRHNEWWHDFFNWNWENFTNDHNSYLIDNITHSMIYRDVYNVSDVTNIFDYKKAKLAYINSDNSNWNRLYIKLHHIFHSLHQTNQSQDFLILITGGSVCDGALCTTINELDKSTNYEVNNINAWCSWSRRFVRSFQISMNKITDYYKLPKIIVKFRICCGGGCSSVVGLDTLLSKSYAMVNTCGKPVDYTVDYPLNKSLAIAEVLSSFSYDFNVTDFSPDLIIWEHSVNDANSKFFKGKTPRDVVYTQYLQKALNIAGNPQVICFDTAPLKLSLNFDLGQGKSERIGINNKYEIPMISYAVFDDEVVELNPFYATHLNNAHPSWETHVIWCQILWFNVFSHVHKVFHNYGSFDSTKMDSLSFLNSTILKESLLNESSMPLDHSFCDVYSSYIDFSKVSDTASPQQVNGDWKYQFDHHKMGWIYLHEINNETDVETHEKNKISFFCRNSKEGKVRIIFYRSYGDEWGSTSVSFSRFNITTRIASPFVFEGNSLLDSKWDLEYSILQSQDYQLANFSEDSIIIIEISVVTGRKFNLQGFACC